MDIINIIQNLHRRLLCRNPEKNPCLRGKKALLIIGIIVLLVLLFFLSFWITSMTLKSNQDPNVAVTSGEPAVKTPKPSYKDLEQMVIEKDQKIAQLESELESYKKQTPIPSTSTPKSNSSSGSSGSSGSSTKKTTAPVQTKAPTAKPTAKPTVQPTVKPTAPPAAPTQAPAANTAASSTGEE